MKSRRGGSRLRRIEKEERALAEARKTIRDLSLREKLLVLTSLYWAEGSKKDLSFSNSDPDLVRIFSRLLLEMFGVKEDRLKISIRLYEDLDKSKSLIFWSNLLNIPVSKFGVNVLPGRKVGKLKYGMCRIRLLRGGDILKKIFGVKKAVSEQFAPIA